jgi:predicted transcriptional regulator of viral defense system
MDSERDRDWRRIVATARRQHGAFTTRQAIDAGVDRAGLHRLVRNHVIYRRHRGVYVLEGGDSFEQRVMAACLATSGRASHWTAARVWGFDSVVDREVHVVIPGMRSGGRDREGISIHTTKVHVTLVTNKGIPVTSPARTLVDLARLPASEASDDELGDLIGHFVAARLATVERLTRTLERECAEVSGVARARRLLETIGGPVESVAEAQLTRLLAAAGLPRPVLQHEACDATGRLIGRLDVAWPPQQVALELDGFRFHSHPTIFVADRERHNRLTASGWTLMRTTPASVRDRPGDLVASLWRVLGTTADEARRQPAG